MEKQAERRIRTALLLMQHRILNLNLYPVKGCGSIQVSEIKYGQHGPDWDRAWIFIDESNKFLSQRNFPKLATCRLRQKENQFQILIPHVDQWFNLENNCESDVINLDVWGNQAQGFIQNCIPAEILNSFFGQKAKLLFFNDKFKRKAIVDGKTINATTRFSDSQPILVVNSKSLDDLNARLTEKISIDRFRANIVIQADEAWEEDQWKEIHFPNLKLKQSKKTARCVVINVNQQTAATNPEPLKKLAVERKEDNKILFGAYFYAENFGTVKVEDLFKIIK